VETALTLPTEAYAPELARRVGVVVATLRTVIGCGFAGKPHLFLLGAPLWNRLAEPAAAEILALIPVAERILRPLRRMLGLGPYDPTRRRRKGGRKSAGPRQPRPCVAKAAPYSADATILSAALSGDAQQPSPAPPVGRLIGTSPGGFTWYRLPTPPLQIIRHAIV
jgi:hypothetical protein